VDTDGPYSCRDISCGLRLPPDRRNPSSGHTCKSISMWKQDWDKGKLLTYGAQMPFTSRRVPQHGQMSERTDTRDYEHPSKFRISVTICHLTFNQGFHKLREPEQCSWYSNWTAKGSGSESWWGQEFSLLHVVQNSPVAHAASYPMGSGGSFPGSKAAGAWSWPLTSN
jgi:hypothetical protein